MTSDPEGMLFDLAEATAHDGPGLRITVFLKGCPLRCRWCHSPEGQSPEPEILRASGLTRVAGERWRASALAEYLNRRAPLLEQGGVTFSGGEPLSQPKFVEAVTDRLERVHTLLDTSGHGDGDALVRLAGKVDEIHYGLKVLDERGAEHWTGCGSTVALTNLARIDAETDTPVTLRIPLLPGVTDTPENLAALAALAHRLRRLQRIEWLPANPAAGAKYAACGRHYDPGFDPHRAPATELDEFPHRVPVPVIRR